MPFITMIDGYYQGISDTEDEASRVGQQLAGTTGHAYTIEVTAKPTTVECPTCGSPANVRCENYGRLSDWPHSARIELVQA